MRRQAVHINQAMLPLAAVVACSMVILVVWQIVDPLTWSRKVTNRDEEAAWISYGECNSKDVGVLPFVIPLGFIIAISVFMTGAISWKLKDVQADLAETKWIFFGIFSHIQVWAIGIPVFIILDDVSRDASYLISAALTFIFSISLVALVIWPKIYVWARNTYFGGPPKPKVSISVGKKQTVVSGLETGSTLESNTSACGGADRARADANARRVQTLESEMEAMKRDYEKEKTELTTLIEDLRAQQNGAVMDAEVRHAGQPELPSEHGDLPQEASVDC